MGRYRRSVSSNSPGPAKSARRRARARYFRATVESLEDRRLLAMGLFNENFSDDLDLSLPGFDEADIYPARDINPHDPSDTTYDDPTTLNTVAPDELRIVNDLPRYGPPSPAEIDGQFLYNRYHLAPGGPTDHFGYYQILEWNSDNDPSTSLPNGHYLFVRSGVVLGPLVDFSFPIQADEAVSVVAFSLQGFCRFRISGANGVLEVPFFSSSWQRIVVSQDQLIPSGLELGAIDSLSFIAGPDGGNMSLDDLTVLVGEAQVNEAPVARDDTVLLDRETGVSGYFNPLENDDDPDFDSFSLISHTEPDPALGTLQIVGGNFFFTATDAFRNDPSLGPATFTYAIRDEQGAFDTATVTIHGFFGVPDAYPVPHGATGTFVVAAGQGVLVNDSNPLGAGRSIRLWENARFGSVTLLSDGSFAYSSARQDGLIVGDTFSYELRTGNFVEIVPVSLNPLNERPVGRDGQFFLFHGQRGPLRALLNVSDADQDDFVLRLADAPRIGRLTMLRAENGVAEFEYSPHLGDFRGYDSFTFYVDDGYSVSNLVRIEFLVPNTPPIVRDFEHSPAVLDWADLINRPSRPELYCQLGPDGSSAVSGSLLRTDSDLDGDSLRALLTDKSGTPLGSPQHGTVTLAPDGETFTYIPNPGYHVFGVDYFAYAVTDGAEVSNIAWVTVRQILGAGKARSEAFAVVRRETLEIHSSVLLGNDFFLSGLPATDFAYGLRITVPAVGGADRLLLRRADNDMPLDFGDIVPTGVGIIFDAPFRLGVYDFEYQFVYLDPLDAHLVSEETLFGSDSVDVLIRVVESLDSDVDGVNDATEAAYDADDNGILDVFEPHVATLDSVQGDPQAESVAVSVIAGAGTHLFGLEAIAPPAALPPGVDLPLGMFQYQLVGLEPGGTTTVRLIPQANLTVTGFYKYGRLYTTVGTTQINYLPRDEDGWYDFAHDGRTGAVIINDPLGYTRLIVLFLEDGARGDDDGQRNGIIVDPGGPVIFTSPQIESMVVNAGLPGSSAQRSMVNRLAVAFSEVVTIDKGAFELRRGGTSKAVDLKIVTSVVDNRTVAHLTFKNGRDVTAGSLKDGTYRLTVRGDKVRDAEGNVLDGDGDSLAGGNYVDEFFRLFGDSDGDGDLDQVDRNAFQSAYGSRRGDADYLWYLDWNANGKVWKEDLALFQLGYCRRRR